MSRPASVADLLDVERVAERAALLLQRPGAWLEAAQGEYRIRTGPDRRRRPLMRMDDAVFARLTREPGLSLRAEGGWSLARARPRSADTGGAGVPLHRAAAAGAGSEVGVPGRNVGESPLTWLARRKGADGQPLLSRAELAAGEKLRQDFERCGTLGRLTMAWDGAPQSKSGRGLGADPLEHGRAARARVSAALTAVGPELRPILEQVCVGGVGITAAEAVLKLPRRSGRTVLKLALQRLAGHYRIG